MHEDIFRTSERICKAKALALVEPLNPRRLNGQIADPLCHLRREILSQRRPGALGRTNRKNFNGLRPPRGPLNLDIDLGPVRDRALSEITQHICMQKNIRSAFIADDEAKAFYRIKPLYPTLDTFPIQDLAVIFHCSSL